MACYTLLPLPGAVLGRISIAPLRARPCVHALACMPLRACPCVHTVGSKKAAETVNIDCDRLGFVSAAAQQAVHGSFIPTLHRSANCRCHMCFAFVLQLLQYAHCSCWLHCSVLHHHTQHSLSGTSPGLGLAINHTPATRPLLFPRTAFSRRAAMEATAAPRL